MTFNFAYNYPQVARDSGFKLRNYRDGPLDWRLVGSMEIERIVKEQRFEQIDSVLSHLSEVPLGSILDSNILDSGISKYFMLSQFSIQYLIFCRKFLEETVSDLRESHSASQMELASLKRSLSEANNEILQLHKKITEMEAIHEVIYPCHLCTKNFVSNDALNLHISRKHNGSLVKSEKKSEVAHPLYKERENDLTLINTIKLELEIKHLKERLNSAEREIKEKNFESDIKNVPEIVSTVLQNSEKISVHSVGIQSNLCEIKETDDSRMDDPRNSSLNRQQLCMLQEKLQEFGKWKEELNRENSEFLTEINNKMQDMGTALEMASNQRVLKLENEEKKSTLENLESLLAEKVEEIGKASAANIECVVKKLEMDYKDKLHQLEKEFIKLNEQYVQQRDLKSNENPIKIEDCFLQATKIQPKDEIFKIAEVITESQDCKNNTEHALLNEHPLKETSASESNHTFVKYSNVKHVEKDSEKCNNSVSTAGMSEEDCTDVSASLLDEENLEKTYNETIKDNASQTHILKKSSSRPPKEVPTAVELLQQQTKGMTRKNARKLTNNRLSSLGVDIKTKTLTPLLKKRCFDDLKERRNKLEQKHPQYYATRNKIKKFVDKLCSTKISPNAKALLKVTKYAKPKVQTNLNEDEYSLSEKEGTESLKASTPLNEKLPNDNFKQRLERILASPIRKPDDHLINTIGHSENKNKNPVPMPRKRVMFNHPEVQQRSSNQSLSLSDSSSQ